jgi:hypothetical protein
VLQRTTGRSLWSSLMVKETFAEEGSVAERAVDNLYNSLRSVAFLGWDCQLWLSHGFDIVWPKIGLGPRVKIVDEAKFMLFVLEWS